MLISITVIGNAKHKQNRNTISQVIVVPLLFSVTFLAEELGVLQYCEFNLFVWMDQNGSFFQCFVQFGLLFMKSKIVIFDCWVFVLFWFVVFADGVFFAETVFFLVKDFVMDCSNLYCVWYNVVVKIVF